MPLQLLLVHQAHLGLVVRWGGVGSLGPRVLAVIREIPGLLERKDKLDSKVVHCDVCLCVEVVNINFFIDPYIISHLSRAARWSG